ncbi:DEAD/DEAH box helicase [Nocardioides sp.]|uniref:DEAD/DEAH box helicase n=1 Tax=Nocardioides sp. TaxID=35761 RepID=UPI002B76E097|nr:DEAD/DEAH box helicase [Nocardioides sp.]HVX55823.1 DEAD/DEAH box helicase [Nocardioides sp.]
MTSFASLGLPEQLSHVLTGLGIETPTPIQAATLPDSLAGRDVLGRGRTGSGKTYAFLLPLVARLAASGKRPNPRAPRALILAPTRELVTQIEASLTPLAQAAGLTSRTVFGGVGQNPQVTALRRGVDIVIACPGRLEDLIGQGHCTLAEVEITVLDEADHMADLGFLPGVRRLLAATPKTGQRLLFSATLDKAIDALVRQFLHQPVTHEADSVEAPVTAMTHHVLHIEREHRVPVLVDLTSAPGRTVVFTRTKHGAKALARQLNRNGVPTVELHGNLSQNARTRNMDAFHSGEATALVATDIAARGIHVDDVALVIHADPPAEHKAYLHRSGRTARAGSSGTVVTLMTSDQVRDVRDLARAAGIKPTTTRVSGTSDAILLQLAPGERIRPGAFEPVVVQPERQPSGERTSSRKSRPGSRARKRQAADGMAPAQRGRSGQSQRPAAKQSSSASGQVKVANSTRTGTPAKSSGPATSGSPATSGGGNRRRRRGAGGASGLGSSGASSSVGGSGGRPHSAASFSSGRR